MLQPSLSTARTSRGYSASWTDQLWMYVTRGSGLWYYAGRTLLCSDTQDLANLLNASYCQHRVGNTKPPLFEPARRRLAGAYDSISFDSHIDGACCFRMVMHELFSLHLSSGRCPVSSRMRRGWPPTLRQCNCTTNSGAPNYGSTLPPGQRCAAKSTMKCQRFVKQASLNRTLQRSCTAPRAKQWCAAAGDCCRATKWPLGEASPDGWPVEFVC